MADFKIEGNKLIPLTDSCKQCFGQGNVCAPYLIPCTKCKGTGLKGRGKCSECNGKYTYDKHPGQVKAYDKRITCPTCNGINSKACSIPDLYCYISKELWQSLTFKVYRDNRVNSWNENYLGIGCVYSCTDYGSAHGMTDSEVINSVRDNKDSHSQACKIAKEDWTVCNHIGIFVTTNGYSVRAVYGIPEEVKAVINSEVIETPRSTLEIYK